MAAINLRDIIEVHDVIGSELQGDAKHIIYKLGDATNTTGEQDNIPAIVWNPFGLASMPAIASQGIDGAAEALVIKTSNYDYIIGGRDGRNNKLYGSMKPGDTALYCAGQGRMLLKADGTASLYTSKGNTDSGTSVVIQVAPSGEINLASEFGGISLQSDKLTMLSASGSGVQFNASGASITGQTIVCNGSVVLGDASATGVATLTTMTPFMTAVATKEGLDAAFLSGLIVFMTALTTYATAIQAIADPPAAATPALISAIGALTALITPTAGAATSLAAVAPLPTNFSLNVKAS